MDDSPRTSTTPTSPTSPTGPTGPTALTSRPRVPAQPVQRPDRGVDDTFWRIVGQLFPPAYAYGAGVLLGTYDPD